MIADATGPILGFLIVLIIVGMIARVAMRVGAIAVGRSSCRFCHKDLVVGSSVCSKCGRTQPWAKVSS